MKGKKNLLVTAFLLMGIGLVLMAIAYPFGGRPGYAVSEVGISTNRNSNAQDLVNYKQEKKELEEFHSISVEGDMFDVWVEEGDAFAVEYNICGNGGAPVCEVEDGTLMFRDAENRKNIGENYYFSVFWVSYGSIDHSDTDYVKITIPKDQQFHSVYMDVSFGEILWDAKADAKAVKLDNSFGDMTVRSLHSTGSQTIHNSNADLVLRDITAQKINLSTCFGELDLKDVKSEDLDLSNSNGNVKLSEFTADNLKVESSFGIIDISDGSGKNVKITNSNGDVLLQRNKGEELNLETSFGDVTAESVIYSKNTDIRNSNGDILLRKGDGEKLNLETSFGDVTAEGVVYVNAKVKTSNTDVEFRDSDITYLEADNSFGILEVDFARSEKRYNIDADTSFGSVIINRKDQGESCHFEEAVPDGSITLVNSNGDIHVKTKE